MPACTRRGSELGTATLWTIVNRGDRGLHRAGARRRGDGRRRAWFEVDRRRGACRRRRRRSPCRRAASPAIVAVDGRRARRVAGDARCRRGRPPASDDTSFPVRADRPGRRAVGVDARPPEPDAIVVDARPVRRDDHATVCRETGMYDGAPFVEAWKPLPPLPPRRTSPRRTPSRSAASPSARVEVSERRVRRLRRRHRATRRTCANRFAAHWRDERAGAPAPATSR